jgi:hypothetical protein
MGTGYVLLLLFIKNHKFANDSTTAEASEKISADLEYLEFY